MAKKQTNTESKKKIEREYVIPIRPKVRTVPRYKKSNKAIKTIKEFLAKHMKVEDRDLNKIKLDLEINEIVWKRGIKKPIHKIKVKAVKQDDGTVIVSAIDSPDKIKFRHSKIKKRESAAKEALESKKSMMQKAKESMKGSPNQPGQDQDNDGVDDKVEEKEKQKAEEKANKDLEKQMAKQAKHTTEPKTGKEKAANIKSQDRTSRGH